MLSIIPPDAPIQSVLSPDIEDDNEEIPNFIKQLSRYCTTLTELHLCRPHWNAEVLMHVATLLPKIKSFTFTRMIPGLHHHSNAAFLEACEKHFLFSAPSVNYASKLYAVENYRASLLCPATDVTPKWSNYGAIIARPSIFVSFRLELHGIVLRIMYGCQTCTTKLRFGGFLRPLLWISF